MAFGAVNRKGRKSVPSVVQFWPCRM